MSVHTFSCLDGHTCGNPVRLVSGGAPLLKGNTMSERRLDFLANHDWIRKALMFEPRGHDVMSGSMLYPPTRADCVRKKKRNSMRAIAASTICCARPTSSRCIRSCCRRRAT